MRNDWREAEVDTAKAVANYFLNLGFEEGIAIDHLKLQKLVYYAHAWHLGYGLGPLFPDDIEAWPHGPVVRDLYVEYADVGNNPITRLAKGFDGLYADDVDDASQETRDLLNEVWRVYREYPGTRLSNATHLPGEPWAVIRDRYGDLSRKPRIPNELIEETFKKRAKQSA